MNDNKTVALIFATGPASFYTKMVTSPKAQFLKRYTRRHHTHGKKGHKHGRYIKRGMNKIANHFIVHKSNGCHL